MKVHLVPAVLLLKQAVAVDQVVLMEQMVDSHLATEAADNTEAVVAVTMSTLQHKMHRPAVQVLCVLSGVLDEHSLIPIQVPFDRFIRA
ncbi:hypothetical protein DRQ50_14245 [bacterium]|nr:MAG: hypothetical protein DRQ50_14245 [bacterium]